MRDISDASGLLTHAADYSPYGTPLTMSESPSSFGFAGEMSGDPTGLTYLRARYYHPTSGTFLSQDPVLGVVGGPASTFNPYLYVRGNPVNWTDPSGEFIGDLVNGVGELLQRVGQGVSDVVNSVIDWFNCPTNYENFEKALLIIAAVGLGIVLLLTLPFDLIAAGIGAALSAAWTFVTSAASAIGSWVFSALTSKAATTFLKFAFLSGFADYGIQRLSGKNEDEVDWGSVLLSGVKGGLLGGWVEFAHASQYITNYLTNVGTRFLTYATGAAAINAGFTLITGKPKLGERTIFNTIADGISGFVPAVYVVSDSIFAALAIIYERYFLGEAKEDWPYEDGLEDWMIKKRK